MAKFSKSPYLGSHRQVHAMKSLYPQFTARSKGDEIIFEGELRVKDIFPIYRVAITFRGSSRPLVKILNPTIDSNAPHLYPSGTLCLYKPANWKWHIGRLIANEIVSWTAGWIYFYETWLQTGIWEGPEAAHDDNKL